MTASTTEDIPKDATSVSEIQIYGPDPCPNCDAAIRVFDQKGLVYKKTVIEPGDPNYVYVTQEKGYMMAPLIEFEIDGKHIEWGGSRMDLLMAIKRMRLS